MLKPGYISYTKNSNLDILHPYTMSTIIYINNNHFNKFNVTNVTGSTAPTITRFLGYITNVT